MKKTTLIISSFIIIVFYSLINISIGFENNKENYNRNEGKWLSYSVDNISNGKLKGGHDTLTSEAVILKEQVHKKTDEDGGIDFRNKIVREAFDIFRTGAHDEDTNKVMDYLSSVFPFLPSDPPFGGNGWGNYFYHFYNPDTGWGLKGFLKPAYVRANDYALEIRKRLGCRDLSKVSAEEKRNIYDLFGRILHLLQDMGNSAHTQDDIHVFTNSFEDYVRDHWAEIVQSEYFRKSVTAEEYLRANFDNVNALYPEPLMKTLALISSRYPTDGFWGKLSEEEVKVLARDLIPWTVLMSGAYIDSIYKLMSRPVGGDCIEPPPLPRSPAGDHPDERFDVSDEFYWEREFKLTEDDLIDLLLRTAVKKGKVGVWYKKKMLEKFYEGRALYANSSPEVREAREVEFQGWVRRLEARVNEAEGDWQGAPDVALFTNGFYDPSISLMLKIKEPVSFLDLVFAPQMIKDHPLLLVPTGGFYGLEKSSLLKVLLAEYVKSGGTLIVFAQQHGADWQLLPTPEDLQTGESRPVSGYGYQEDQSCSFNSVYIDSYHPVLANFSNSTVSVGVDGYFTSYPENSLVLLRRTANGQPAMILYPYGQGYVLATTLYPDFALTHGQANQAEINLVQNLIAWAKKPEVLPEVRPGEAVDLRLPLTNFTDLPSAAVKFTVLDVDRKVVEERLSFLSLSPGQTLTIPFSFSSLSSSPLGIYRVDYTLVGEQGEVVQPQAEVDASRFVVSKPPQTGTPDKPFWFFISTSSQEVLFGGTLNYTFHIINNTEESRSLKIKNKFRHTGREREWVVTAGPKQETLVSATDLFLDSYWMFETMEASLSDEAGRVMGRGELSFKGLWPSVKASLAMDKRIYRRDERATIQALFQSNVPLSWQAVLKTSIFDARNQRVFADGPQLISFAPYENKSQTGEFQLPFLNPGSYCGRVEVWFADRLVASASTTFELIESKINITPLLPSPLGIGPNNFIFLLENVGQIDVSSGNLQVSLKDPQGKEVFYQVNPFTLKKGEAKTIELALPIAILEFGSYTLIFQEADETKVNILPVQVSLPNLIRITPGFDKTYYRVREVAYLSARVENGGKFFWPNGQLSIFIPEANYSINKAIDLGAGQSEIIKLPVPLPANLTPGFHDVEVTFSLPQGGSFTQKTKVAILPSSLEAKYTGPEDLRAGDNIELILENKGGVDTLADILITFSGNGQIIYQRSFADLVMAGSSLSYFVPIPTQATAGPYSLMAEYGDRNTQERKSFGQSLSVAGVKADLSLRSDKKIYLGGEIVTALGEVSNKEYALEQAVLNLKIMEPCISATSYHFYTWEGRSWVERGVLNFGSNFETKVIDLSDYLLPDELGVYKLRIRHGGQDSAQVDYLALLAEGVFYAPLKAVVIEEEPYDIRESILYADQWAADVLNDEIEVHWENLPQVGSKVIVMSAQEGGINWSCSQFVYWEKDIALSEAAQKISPFREPARGLNNSGSYLLKGILISQTGQVIAEAEYPFSVSYQGLGLRFSVSNPLLRPGDKVRISGEVLNGREENVADITLKLASIYGDLLEERVFNIPAQSAAPFEFNIVAEEEGEKLFRVDLYYGERRLLGGRGKYEVVNPVLSVTASAPNVVGQKPFPITIAIENPGPVPASIDLWIQGGSLSDQKTLTLLPQEKKQIIYTQAITSDTIYSIKISGDLAQELSLPVVYGERLQIAFSPQNTYPEGKVAVPVSLQNIGQVAEEVQVAFQLKQGGVIVQEEIKDYFLPNGSGQNDILYFDLQEGEYQILAQSNLPPLIAQASFSVRKENKLEMVISAVAQREGVFPVGAELTNLGYNPLAGILRFTLQAQQNLFWRGEEIISLAPGSSQSLSFSLDPSALAPGSYTLKGEFLSSEGRLWGEKSIPLIISGPLFQITQTPPYQTFAPGQEASFSFQVKNTGNQEGPFNFRFKSYDLIDLKRNEWLKPGEEKNLEFSFYLPLDLEEKDYEAPYELESAGRKERGQVKYHLAGINLNVQAALDKAAYREGDTAHLTLTISSEENQELFVRVNYPGFEAKESFTLQGSKVLTFDIPLPKITGEKLFYGVYQASGRSLHLNSLYLYKTGEKLNLGTDKQVYKPGETVRVTLSKNDPEISGTLTLSAPNYEDIFPFSENITKTFTLPSSMAASTYYVTYSLLKIDGEVISGRHPFDIDGLKVKVKEASLEKGKYAPGEIINLNLRVESSHDLEAILKTWIVDPEKKHSPPEIEEITLKKIEPALLSPSLTISTPKQGLHQLIYGLYSKEGLLLCSGMEGFEVGDGIILSLSTDKVDYPESKEPILVKVSLYNPAPATLELFLNGQPKGSYPINPVNLATFQVPLYPENPGLHTLKATLTSENLTSTKETSFTYGSSLPDLVVWINGGKVEEGYLKLSITVLNRGKSPSLPTTLNLYEGQINEEKILATFAVRSLSPKESQTFFYQLPVSGRTGENIFIALIDEEQSGNEFNKNNNETRISLQIKPEEPEIDFILSAEERAKIIELGEEGEFKLTLTPLKEISGDVLLTIKETPPNFSAFFTPNPLPISYGAVSATLKLIPNTQATHGTYLFSVIATREGINQEINLELKITDFTLSILPSTQTINQLGEAQYTINLTPLSDFANPVSLEIQGLPKGTKANLNANQLPLPTETPLTITTSKWLTPGGYNFSVLAKGKKIIHEQMATLIVKENPLLAPVIITAPGREKKPVIKTFLPSGQLLNQWTTFKEKVEIHLTAGDVDGDGFDEIILGADKKGKGPYPLIKILKRDGLPIATLESPGWYKLGAPVATGDIDGDWTEEIAVGYYVMPPKEMAIYDDLDVEEIYPLCHGQKKGKGMVQVYKLIEEELVDSGLVLEPYKEEGFWGAPRVALGDIDGDEKLELITTPGPDPQAPTHLKAFKIDTSKGWGRWQIGEKILDLVIPFIDEKGKKRTKINDGYGANLTTGDLDGDGKAEIILGAGPDPQKDGQIIIIYPTENKRESFPAYLENGWGVNIASGDLDGDGQAEIITGPGPRSHQGDKVKIYKRDGTLLKEWQPYQDINSGIKVTTGRIGK